jgi:uncharacterized repeat protein (TIGR02543 family)
MRIRYLSLTVLILAISGIFLLICDMPAPPPGAEQANIKLILKSSDGVQSTTSITDTAGNLFMVGVILNLTQYIDSTEILVFKDDSMEYRFFTDTKKNDVDTILFPAQFPLSGDRTVLATGYIHENENIELSAIIYVISRPGENYPPTLKVSGWPIVQAGDSVLLTVNATDPDEDQEVSVEAIQFPDNATFESGKFVWETTTDDIGTDTVIFVATDNGDPSKADTDTVVITVSADPVNHPPVLSFEGRHTVAAGAGLAIAVSATDPDEDQTVSIEVLRFPDGATFEDDTLRWTPSEENIGNDTAIFVAADDGDPVLADTDTVVITVTEILTNEPPQWSEDTLRLEGESGVELSRELADLCSDADGDPITFALIPDQDPEGDAIVEETAWSYTPSDNDIGTTYLQIVASDAYDGTDTLIVELMVTGTVVTEDLQPPSMMLFTPAEDSQRVASDAYEVTISCKDESGVASVVCVMGEETFEVTVSEDTLYSAMITGLVSSEWSTVQFITTDSAPAENRDTLLVTLMYDPEATDENPPSITLVSPSTDTVIGESSLEVRVRVSDESGVARVTIGGVEADREDDNVFSATVSDLTGGVYQTLWIVATDSAEIAHTDSTSVQVKYDDDQTGPEFTLVTPDKDSVSTGSDSYTITVVCTDPSGVTSVVADMGGESFTGEHISGDRWDIGITGLAEGDYNEVIITATDGSLGENTETQKVYIKYDPMIEDETGPTITLISPSEDTTVAVDSCVITVRCTDQSGVASVGLVVGEDTISAVEGSDHLFSGTVKNLAANVTTTVTVVAVDSVEPGNSNSTSLQVTWEYVPSYTLTVSATNGSVVREPDLEEYDSGTEVTLTPVPADNYHFVGWEGDLTGTDDPATITMDGEKTVTALFEENPPNTFTLSVMATHGSVTKTPNQPQYDEGSVVGLKAVADPGYHFVNWTGDATGTGDSVTITMDATKSVTANFAINTYALTVGGDGNGTTDPDGEVTVNQGAATDISATPATDYRFSGWTVTSGTATIATPSSATTTVTLTSGDATVQANFTNIEHTLTVETGGHGTTDPEGDVTVNQGAATDISATPATDYRFSGWTVTSGTATIATPSSATTTVTLTSGNATVQANFTNIEYTLTVETDGYGTTDPEGDVTVNQGAATDISATPGTGYTFSGWTVTSGTATIATPSSATTTVTLTSDDATVMANFILINYTLTLTNDGHGTTTPNSSTTADHGVPTNVSATPSTGYEFSSWALISTAGTATIANLFQQSTNVTLYNDATIRANFLPGTFYITFNKNDPEATGTMNRQPITFNSSAYLSYNSFQKPGWNFSGWATSPIGSAVYQDHASYTMETEGVELYACWTPAIYTISFDKNNSDAGGTLLPVQAANGSSVQLPLNQFTDGCRTFEGWSTSKDGPAQWNDGGYFTMGGADVKLYAQWAVSPVTVTPAFGSPETPVCLTDGGTLTVNAPCAVGWEWYIDLWGSGNFQLLEDSGTLFGQGTPTLTCGSPTGGILYCIVTDLDGRQVQSGTYIWSQGNCDPH